MGKRYRNHLRKVKDLITYTVYIDGQYSASFPGDKKAAEAHAERSQGNTTIRKTRIQVPVDKLT